MNKKILLLCCSILFLIMSIQVLTVKGEEMQTVEGAVQEVAEDNSYIVINDEKMTVDEEIRDYMTMEVGDEVEVTIEDLDGQKIIRDFNYL